MNDISHRIDLAPSAPLDSANALPSEAYIDTALARPERERVFAPSWQLVGHTSSIPAAGDHLVSDAAGIPLVIVRGDDGEIRALHNVCRHRAGPLALEDGKGARSLRCRYHGWNYALDGCLKAAIEMEGARDFDAGEIRLPQARIAEWQGFLFAAIGAVPELEEVLAGISERMAPQRLGAYVRTAREHYDIACDWKVYVDNYLEGYHVPHIHPALNRMLDYRSYRTETARWHSLQWSPLESSADLYGNGDALYWFVWPNTMLNVLPGRVQTNRVLPLEPGRCRVVFDYYYAAAGDDAAQRRDREFSHLVQHEDVSICEAVQRGLASGSYRAGRLNPARESGVHHFQELWRAAMRRA
jgi:choline monooxygenase